ncbi:hypothetical protein VSU16_07100 [Cetobacterium somerae]|uniref:hypothetical protein n=1 Tax=Cetobacterium somerae TaxID=188913 RepID=UPI002E7AE286|nr:hypothetical protein [Cetobacterium somerae]WVJ00578.1 hypothetical protein VSU16_07100 [Cetobacterium somerae]
MKLKTIIALLTFACFSLFTYSAEFTLEELKELKSLNMITDEEYQILLNELEGVQERENFFNLKVNGAKVSDVYPIIVQDNKIYLPVINLFNTIGFKDYSIQSEILKATLGTDVREVTLKPSDSYVLVEKSDFFVESEKFKELFLRDLYIDQENSSVSMRLSFETSAEIEAYLANVKDGLMDAENAGELMFTSERTLFDVGYMRFDFQGVLNKAGKDSEDRKLETDWTGNLEYQGPLLYGEFTAAYDVRNSELGNMSLYYPDIYKNHSLKLENNGNGGAREWAASFRKERGYYIKGKNYVIRETVPIGSRVELLYLGFPIDVKDAVDGSVEFDNSEIQENRRYTLRVYQPDGRIYTIDIDTAANYFQQNKGETEYDISFREVDQYDRYSINANLYYGITQNLTLGLGYVHEPEDVGDGRIEYLEHIRGEVVYSNYIYRFPYTLVLGTERALNTSVVNDEGVSNKDRYSYDGTFQIDVKDFRFIVDRAHYGKYFDEKSDESYSITYNPTGIFQINYEWSKTKYNIDQDDDNDESVGLNISKGWQDFLLTFDYSKSLKQEDSYEVNMYYNGFKKYNVQLTNYWLEDGKDLETTLRLTNKNIFSIFDYSLEFGYSESYKEKFTFRFTLDYDNWFRSEVNFDETGAQRYSAGINRVVDLKNIRKPLESIDSTRVKVVTFLDKNDNGVMDADEERVDYVAVKIGDQEIDTDENGEAMFFGVPNKIVYDMKPTIRKPSYTIGDTKIKILGQQVGTVTAHIPIKPMVTIVGEIQVDKNLNLKDKEKEAIFENILVKVLDEKGKLIEYLNPESDGTFEVSGLYARKYMLQVEYIGVDNKAKKITENVVLGYYDDRENRFIIHLDRDRLTLKQIFLSEGGKYEKVISSNSSPSKL